MSFITYYHTSLKFFSSFHTSQFENDTDLDKIILRDPLGKIIIPGTSISGILRQWIKNWRKSLGIEQCIHELDANTEKTKVCYCPECTLLGTYYELKKDDPTLIPLKSSLIIFDGLSKEFIRGEYKDGIKINSITGTADSQQRALYQLETVPRTLEVIIKFRLQTKESDPIEKRLFDTFLIFGKNFMIHFGSKKTQGMGYCQITEIKAKQLNLKKKEDFLLEFSPTNKFDLVETANLSLIALDNNPSNDLYKEMLIECNIKNNHQIIINGSLEKNEHGVSFFPKEENNVPVIPGSSIKGIFRHQTNKIVNLLNEINSYYKGVIEEVFGSTDHSGKVSFIDSYIQNKVLHFQDMVAIDRFTGGALDKGKFDVISLLEPEFKIQIIMHEPTIEALKLLLLIIRDIRDGYVTFGLGSSKGFGNVSVLSLSLHLIKPDISTPPRKIDKIFENASERKIFPFIEETINYSAHDIETIIKTIVSSD